MENTRSITWLWLVAALVLLVWNGLQMTAWARGEEAVIANDSDGDRVVDTVDVDDDNDGITDINEIAANGLDVDTDKDGIVDRLDLDSDNDGILDWQESGAVLNIDFSAMRVVGGRLLGSVGENGFIDALETIVDGGQMRYSLVNSDAEFDALPDVIDLDSDNDGLPDLNEAGVDASFDNDGDGRVDISNGSVGADGIANRMQLSIDKSCCDVNGDGIEDIVPRNTDGTDLPDFQDLDSDNDGTFDLVEAGGTDFDSNGRVDNFFDSPVLDGMDDAILAIPLTPGDINGNAVPDHVDQFVQGGTTGSTEPATNVATGNNASDGNNSGLADDDASGSDITSNREPAARPGADLMSEADGPLSDEAADGSVRTGLNAAGCSIQSTGTDLLLLLLAVLAMTVLGWRYTIKRIKQPATPG